MTTTPAGWYPDPYGSPQLRWWDGSQWTDATHPLEHAGEQAAGAQPGFHVESAGQSPAQSGAPAAAQPGFASGGQPGGQPSSWGYPAQGTYPEQGGYPGGHQSGYPGPGGYPSTAQMPMPDFGAQPKKAPLWPWVLGGVALIVSLSLVVGGVVFFIKNRNTSVVTGPSAAPPSAALPSAEPSPSAPASPSPEASPAPSALPVPATLPQPSGGRIVDPVAGLSYVYPGAPWEVPNAADIRNPDNATLPQWTSGYSAVSHEDFEGQSDWLGTVYAAQLPELGSYTGPQDLGSTARLLVVLYESLFYSPQHERKFLRNEAFQVSGRQGWIIEFEMDFSKQAKSKGWKWKKEKGAFVLVDRGAGQRPSLLYISVPDNLDQSVMDRVLDSLEAS